MKRVNAIINIQNLSPDEKENVYTRPYIRLTSRSPIGFPFPETGWPLVPRLLRRKKTLFKETVCAIMPPICNSD
jgi:hypothetical protein